MARGSRRGSTKAHSPTKASAWADWHGPKIFLPLAGVLVAAVGVAVSAFDGGEGAPPVTKVVEVSSVSDPTPAQPVASQVAVGDASAQRPARSESLAPAPAKKLRRPSTTPPPSPPALAEPERLTSDQHVSVNHINVQDSPGAVTGAVVTVNSVSVRPEQ